jgi:hypothetical protein
MSIKKILTIPDLHGKTNWKSVFDPYFDHIVFLGDYFDAFDDENKTNTDMIDNILRIIELKKNYPDKVILLWGNHELHYLFTPTEYQTSGFRMGLYPVLHQLLNRDKNLFQYAFQIKNYIWTHAGIHIGWWNFRFKGDNEKNISDQLNETFLQKKQGIHDPKVETLMDCGIKRWGSEKVGGPLWADKTEMWLKGIPGYNQIVGHSKVFNIVTSPVKKDASITFCDCLCTTENYHIVEIPDDENKL